MYCDKRRREGSSEASWSESNDWKVNRDIR
jgi:hypothetical protein